ncbi:MAG: glycosyltransferase [Aquabacterium sp.]|uniref:glycosyltransferase n=1 Tax=Aquabacterium sp. TaxID=1872578 RepID=UPI0027157D7A|nr:glycosyltransferase [Aquabacterium sp.]MDO9005996.1 glycosyltransferase [Aquabacterium sp.]
MNICFVTDGGAHLGLGHVQQSMALARELISHADITFITKSDHTVRNKITENGFKTIGLENDGEIFNHLELMDPDVVIFDKLDVAEALACKIKQELRARLIIFTNLSTANRFADVAVTADIGSRFENIRFLDEQTNTEYLYGPRYWVLRRDFYEYQKRGKEQVKSPTKILLIFGGSDPANLTSAALDQLLGLKRHLIIEVVLGAHFFHDEDLQTILQKHQDKRENVKVHRNISNVAELMHRSHLVIASPGLSAFEALKVGTPIIIVPHDELQRDTYHGFMRMLGRDELERLGVMIEHKDFTYPADEAITRMQIGEGLEDLKDIILSNTRRAV